MSTDLDAVRKVYGGGQNAAYAAMRGDKRTLYITLDVEQAAHDAGLAAVVEWAMNRAATLVLVSEGRYLDIEATRDALLKDLTERKN